jgi:hypothetical protein
MLSQFANVSFDHTNWNWVTSIFSEAVYLIQVPGKTQQVQNKQKLGFGEKIGQFSAMIRPFSRQSESCVPFFFC